MGSTGSLDLFPEVFRAELQGRVTVAGLSVAGAPAEAITQEDATS